MEVGKLRLKTLTWKQLEGPNIRLATSMLTCSPLMLNTSFRAIPKTPRLTATSFVFFFASIFSPPSCWSPVSQKQSPKGPSLDSAPKVHKSGFLHKEFNKEKNI